MDIKPNHRLEFELDGQDETALPVVPDPSYIYKVGEKFKYYSILEEEGNRETLGIFEVVDVEHELFDAIVGEQVTVIHVRKI